MRLRAPPLQPDSRPVASLPHLPVVRLRIELPDALRRTQVRFSEIAMEGEVVQWQPLRNLLTECRINGELSVPEIERAIDAVHGALGQVALIRPTRDGELNADAVAEDLVPLIISSISPVQ